MAAGAKLFATLCNYIVHDLHSMWEIIGKLVHQIYIHIIAELHSHSVPTTIWWYLIVYSSLLNHLLSHCLQPLPLLIALYLQSLSYTTLPVDLAEIAAQLEWLREALQQHDRYNHPVSWRTCSLQHDYNLPDIPGYEMPCRLSVYFVHCEIHFVERVLFAPKCPAIRPSW
jgi:hypothetical protein